MQENRKLWRIVAYLDPCLEIVPSTLLSYDLLRVLFSAFQRNVHTISVSTPSDTVPQMNFKLPKP